MAFLLGIAFRILTLIPPVEPLHLLFHCPSLSFGGLHFLVAKLPGEACPKPLVIEATYAVNFQATISAIVEVVAVGAQHIGAGQAYLQAFVQKVLAESKTEILISSYQYRPPPYPIAVPSVSEVHQNAPGQLEVVLYSDRPGDLAKVNFGALV